MATVTLRKAERLNSKKTIDVLFRGGGSSSMSAFPIRVVYRLEEPQESTPAVQMMVSVPKKCFKRAVKRNRVKRQVREAYRQHKQALWDKLSVNGKSIVMSFIWLDDKLHDSAYVDARIANLLTRIEEKL